MIGHGDLARRRAVLADGLDGGDGRELLEPRVEEGVGGVVGHLGGDLEGGGGSSQGESLSSDAEGRNGG